MKSSELKKWILSLEQDIEFDYKNNHCSVCPFAKDNISICYLGVNKDYTDIDIAMNDKIFDGKCLNEIVEELEFY